MALRALHVWQLDSDGIPKVDKNGERIPHRKLNTAKTYKELSSDEKASFDNQVRVFETGNHTWAANFVREYEHARALLAQAPK